MDSKGTPLGTPISGGTENEALPDTNVAMIQLLKEHIAGTERRLLVEQIKPEWNGDYVLWPTFWKNLNNYWDNKNQGSIYSDLDKCMIFLSCLPKQTGHRTRLQSAVTEHSWTFEKII